MAAAAVVVAMTAVVVAAAMTAVAAAVAKLAWISAARGTRSVIFLGAVLADSGRKENTTMPITPHRLSTHMSSQ